MSNIKEEIFMKDLVSDTCANTKVKFDPDLANILHQRNSLSIYMSFMSG